MDKIEETNETSENQIRNVNLSVRGFLTTREFRIVNYDVFTASFRLNLKAETDVWVVQQRIKLFHLDILSLPWKFNWSNAVMNCRGSNYFIHSSLTEAVDQIMYLVSVLHPHLQSEPAVSCINPPRDSEKRTNVSK